MSKAPRNVRLALTPLIRSVSGYEVTVVDMSETHIRIASGFLKASDTGAYFLVDDKPFLFEQIQSVIVNDKIELHFGFSQK